MKDAATRTQTACCDDDRQHVHVTWPKLTPCLISSIMGTFQIAPQAAAQLAKQEQALQQLVRDAERDADPLRNFSAFCSFNRNDLQARVEAWAAGALPPALAEWALALCRSNMQDIYEGVWGWSDKKKRRQLAHVRLSALGC